MSTNVAPGWRNWQTRQTQNLVLAREWEFDPPSGHHRQRPKSSFPQLPLIFEELWDQSGALETLLTGLARSAYIAGYLGLMLHSILVIV